MISPQSRDFEDRKVSQHASATEPVSDIKLQRRGNSWKENGWRRQLLATMIRVPSPYAGWCANRG